MLGQFAVIEQTVEKRKQIIDAGDGTNKLNALFDNEMNEILRITGGEGYISARYSGTGYYQSSLMDGVIKENEFVFLGKKTRTC